MPHLQGLFNYKPIINQINPIPRIDAYFFKIHFNIANGEWRKLYKEEPNSLYRTF